jgi:hypothetical protein
MRTTLASFATDFGAADSAAAVYYASDISIFA